MRLQARIVPRIVLGIESSCDETAAAIVDENRRILAQAVASQEAEHAPYGGVVPEIAARAHAERLAPQIAQVLDEAGLTLADCDAIAATAGPGLIGGVMVGLVTAKALAMAGDKPLLAINHLEAHALSPRLADPTLEFPYALLLVSGGHCQLLRVDGPGRYRRFATTIDDALGEAFDKTAKILGLGYPGGPAVEKLALSGNAKAVRLPRPLFGSEEPHFSFAGLKSAVLRAKENQVPPQTQSQTQPVRPELVEGPLFSPSAALGKKDDPSTSSGRADFDNRQRGSDRAVGMYSDADIAASFQQAALDCLLDRTTRSLERMGSVTALVVAGGVAANKAVRGALEGLAASRGLAFSVPPPALCTDNAAMVAWAGIERLQAGLAADPLDVAARPRWPLDPEAETVRGAGYKA